MSDARGGAGIVALVDALLAQLDGTSVTECEFRAGRHRVLVRRSPLAAALPARQAPTAAAIPPEWEAIASPLTGIFYAAENPQAQPYLQLGAPIELGQVVCQIESMKMYNKVESDRAGIVRAILPRNGDQVEAGQALVYVEPVGGDS